MARNPTLNSLQDIARRAVSSSSIATFQVSCPLRGDEIGRKAKHAPQMNKHAAATKFAELQPEQVAL
jgi:hypothetical protein